MAKTTISSDLKTKIIKDFKAGLKQKEICKKYDMNKSTICRIVKSFREKGTVNTLHLGGRPRKTSQLQDQLIATVFKESPKVMYKDVKGNFKLDISSRSIYRRAKQAENIIPTKTLMYDTTRSARLQFAKAHLQWTKENWRTAILSTFNVSAQFEMKAKDSKTMEIRNSYKKLKHNERDTLIWGCYTPHSRHSLDYSRINIDYKNILNDVRYAYVDSNQIIFWRQQHDNKAEHTSATVNSWLISYGVSVLKWPSQSTDLNPIEYLWKSMELNILTQNYNSRLDLIEAVKFEWQNISLEIIENLIESMPARCKAVLNNSGYPTHYTNNLPVVKNLNLDSACQMKDEEDVPESIIP